VGLRRSVTPSSNLGLTGWHEEARLVWQKTRFTQHPGFWAWAGAFDGGLDLLLTTTALYLSPATPGVSPFVESWKTAARITAERLAVSLLVRPLHGATHRLHAQRPNAEGVYPFSGVGAMLKAMWAEQGMAVFTRSLVPAATYELAANAILSVYVHYAPVRSFVQRSRASFSLSKFGIASHFLRSLCLAADDCIGLLLFVLATRPLLTVVRRLDIQGSGFELWRVPYKGALDCFSRIWNEEGFAAFYQGAVPEVVINLIPIGLFFLADLIIGRFESFGALHL